MRRLLLVLLFLVLSTPVFAQNAPGQFTKVAITETAAGSLRVGCSLSSSVTSSSCTGGVWAGPIVASSVTGTGVLTMTGTSSAHEFGAGATGVTEVRVKNTTSGTNNGAGFSVVAGTQTAGLYAYTQDWSTSGPSVASGALLQSSGAGGLSLVALDASGDLRFYVGGGAPGTLRGTMTDAGLFDWLGTASFGGTVTLSDTLSAFKFVTGQGTTTFTSFRNTSSPYEWKLDATGTSNSRIGLSTSGTTKLYVMSSGNIKIGGTADRGTTEGTSQVVIFNGTAPAGTLTNGVSLYAAAGELNVMDAAGNNTLLSPHDDETNEVILLSKNTVTGKVLRIDSERLFRAMDKALGGGYIDEWVDENVSAPVTSVRRRRIAEIGQLAMLAWGGR